MHPQIALEPTDWYWAAWRGLAPLARPPAAPFDHEDCCARLAEFARSMRGLQPRRWDWSLARIGPALSAEEALFWFELIPLCERFGLGSARVREHQARQSFDAAALERGRAAAAKQRLVGCPELLVALVRLFDPPEPPAALRHHLDNDDVGHNHLSLPDGFRRYLLPYLGADERAGLREAVRLRLERRRWPAGGNRYETPRASFFLAAQLGCHDLVEALVAQLDPALYQPGPDGGEPPLEKHRPLDMLFGLPSRQALRAEARRLQLWATRPDQIRAWLAATELDDLDWAVESVLRAGESTAAAGLLGALACVRAPELAPTMRMLALRSCAPRIARDWLRAYAPAPDAPPAPDQTPAWLRAALGQVRRPRRSGPEWVDASMLPALSVAGQTLGDAQIEALLDALRQSAPDQPHPLLALIRAHADPAALDALLWRLLACWEHAGAPAGGRWALNALGLLGSDAAAPELGRRIRRWRELGLHRRAAAGLTCLRALGSDAALQTLNLIAQDARLRALRRRAVEELEAAAAARGLTRGQLEDRIVPTFGLDGSGQLDYGPRRFALALGDDLTLRLRDARGQLTGRLPRPAAADDPALVGQARGRWKALKRVLAEEVALQTRRLERCLIYGRRWAPDEFARVLLGHPLLAELARRLIWAGYDADGCMRAAFCLADAAGPTGEDYAPLRLEQFAAVGLAHPLHATPQQRQRWVELLLDFGVVPLLPQGARPLVALEPAELAGAELTRYSGIRFQQHAIGQLARARGWVFVSDHDAAYRGERFYALRRFEDARRSAVIFNRQVCGQGPTYERIERFYVLDGLLEPGDLRKPHTPLPLRTLDPVLLSEMLCDLEAIAASAAHHLRP